jgi:diguanylate cyclase (GGDEF)-like protein/PAS domain S-box-containing protein
VTKYRPHLFVICALAAILLTGLPGAFKNALVDLRFKAFPRQSGGDVVVVAIDSRSMDAIGVWPWPRRIHADLIETLQRAGVSEIAFDVDFSMPSDATSDDAFAHALQAAGGSVILPSFEQPADLKNHRAIYLNRPLPEYARHAWPAIVNVWSEPDGVVRRYPYGETFDGTFLASMGAILAGKFEHNKDPLWIDFSIDAASVPVISYADVLRDVATAVQLAGKKVLVGGTALELGDRFNIPNGGNISGAMLQALATESILQGRMLRPASNVIRWGLPLLVSVLMLLLWRRFSAVRRVTLLLALAVAAELVAMLVQAKFPVIIDTSLLHLVVVSYLAAIALDEIDFRDLLGRIAENRFRLLTMSLGEGVVCCDQRGVITVWNPGATAIFGYGVEEMIGRAFASILAAPPAGSPAFSVFDVPDEALRSPGGRLMELKGRRKTGEVIALEACFSAWQGTDGLQYGAILRDISARKREAERMRYLAEHDTLTGLPNRNALQAHLTEQFAAARSAQCEGALMVVSINKFPLINDMFGRDYGDLVLRAVANRLNALFGPARFVARLDRDEFAVVIGGDDTADRSPMLAEQASRSFNSDPLAIEARRHSVSVSIGIAKFPGECATPEELLGNAHLALYRAIAHKRGHVLFERDIRVQVESRLKLEAELARAVERNEFELYYQPQVSLEDGRVLGAEALIRWRHPERGLVAPGEFMPVVNTSPLSERIAHWVMRTACQQGRSWQQRGRDFGIAINLSPSQLQSDEIVTTVDAVLAETGYPAHLLELEVTENILVDETIAVDVFRRLRDRGVRVVLDDFGTGYGSLTYLKKFPLDGLKIDRSFVNGLRAHEDDAAIVGTIIELSDRLGLSVLAEGIEDGATVERLLRMRCRQGQGYHFGRPMPAAEFEQKFLRGDRDRLRDGLDVAVSSPAA